MTNECNVVTWMGSWTGKGHNIEAKEIYINYRLWFMIMNQCEFINFNKCTIIIQDVNTEEILGRKEMTNLCIICLIFL